MTGDQSKYLVFKLGPESYSTPLLTVREVLEYQKPKFMPNMVPYFSGVINVRGAIVGVVDLRKKLGYEEATGRKTAMLLCDTQRGPVAAIVDSVDCVQEFSEKDVETNPPVKLRVNTSYLVGIAKRDQQLVVILDFLKLLTDDQYLAS